MKVRTLILGLGMMASAFSFSVQNAMASEQGTVRLDKQVKHELNMLPYVNVFDYLTFTVDADNNVTLNGEVTNPVVKSDAGNVVKRIEGVEHVNNRIRCCRYLRWTMACASGCSARSMAIRRCRSTHWASTSPSALLWIEAM